MTVHSFNLAVKDCRLTVEPRVLLTHLHGEIWAAAIEVQTFTGEFISMRFPFHAVEDGDGRWGRIPATHEVARAFRQFRQKLLERELVPVLIAARSHPRLRVRFERPGSRQAA